MVRLRASSGYLCHIGRVGQGNALRVCLCGFVAGCLQVFNQVLNADGRG